MQLAFSTLACPTWTLEQIVRAAVEYGYDGVELRGIGASVDLRAVPELAPGNRQAVRALFADSGLTICCLDSSAQFADPAGRSKSEDELRGYIEIAADLGCPLVRVFGGRVPEGKSRSEAAQAIAEGLNAMAGFAGEHGVGIALETHDAFTTGAEIAPVLAQIAPETLGVVWDMYNAFERGESPSVAFPLLRPYIRHVHVKDGRDGVYCPLGQGTAPVAAMLTLLYSPMEGADNSAYSGFISVEWEKRWHPTLADPEVALPQYATVLRGYGEAIRPSAS